MAIFVWIKGLKGPCPQSVVQELRNGKGETVGADQTLEVHIITDEEALMPLDALIAKYPYTGGSDDTQD